MMEPTLAERLLERFTPDELATVRAALARIEARAKATLAAPPKSSEPAKVEAVAAKVETPTVFTFERGDVATTTENGSTYLYRGDVCYLFAREDEKQPMVSWCHAGMRNTDERNMHRTEIVELLNKRGITAKFPEDTPASDSVKGEVPPYPYDNKEIDMPTANPAASAKALPFAFNGPIVSGPTPAEFSDLRLRVSDLEREVAALKAVR